MIAQGMKKLLSFFAVIIIYWKPIIVNHEKTKGFSFRSIDNLTKSLYDNAKQEIRTMKVLPFIFPQGMKVFLYRGKGAA